MDVNLKHFFFTIKAVLKGMIKNKGGAIVNLSSVSWMLGEGDKVAYETAKSAVIGLTRSFAREFGKYNIRCNSVTPGSIATERQIKHWLTPKYKKFILDKQCLKRQLKPDGSVVKSEILDHARMNKPGQGFYKVLAESALRAIKLCQPLRVPSTGSERWKQLQLNFDAREMLEG